MPTIRYTYGRDVTRHGEGLHQVSGVEARVLVAARRAVLVDPDVSLAPSAVVLPDDAEPVTETPPADVESAQEA